MHTNAEFLDLLLTAISDPSFKVQDSLIGQNTISVSR